VPDPPAREGRSSSRRRSRMCHSHRDAPVRAAESPRLAARSGEAAPRPYMNGRTHHRCRTCLPRWGGMAPFCRGQAVPDPPARQGRQGDARGCGGASTIAAGAVGSERPGLKPRAESASPLKGAGGRPGARGDRLGAGAVWISRLQPAWGLSPAVHGRAIVDMAARLIGAACRARRVGYVEWPRLSARAGEAAPRPYKVDDPFPVGHSGATGGALTPVW
jgi:hypothetical protein